MAARYQRRKLWEWVLTDLILGDREFWTYCDFMSIQVAGPTECAKVQTILLVYLLLLLLVFLR